MNQRNSYNLNGTNLMRLHPMNMGNEAQPAGWFPGHERRNMRNKYPRPIMAGDGYPAVIQPAVCGWEVSWNPDDGLYYIENLVGVVQAKIKDWRNVCQWCNKHSH